MAAKLTVTGFCFWYLARNIDFREFIGAARTLDVRWTALATLLLMLEIPLVAVRWCKIVDVLGHDRDRIKRAPMIAITAIANFFAQLVPNIAADTIRAWMLAQHDYSWRRGLVSVMIDRGVGVASLIAVGFVVMLFPSSLTALGGQRIIALGVFRHASHRDRGLFGSCTNIRPVSRTLALHSMGRKTCAPYTSRLARRPAGISILRHRFRRASHVDYCNLATRTGVRLGASVG